MNIAEKLQIIAENEQKVFEAGKNSVVDPDKIISATAVGTNFVCLNNVSEIKHDINVKITSAIRKNLFPNFITDKTYTNGSFIKVNEDGSITIHKVAGDLINETIALPLNAGVYKLSNGYGANKDIWLQVTDVAVSTYYNTTISNGAATITLPKDDTYKITLYTNKASEVDSITFYPQFEKGTVATPYEPYAPYIQNLEGLEVKAYSKNLLSDAVYDTNNWVREEGIDINSTNSKVYYLDEIPNGTYTISAKAKSNNVYLYFYCSIDGGATWEGYKGSSGTFYIIASKNSYSITFEKTENTRFLIWHNNINFSGDVDYIQIEAGETTTDYEPYKESVSYITNENGEVIIKSFSPYTNIYAEKSEEMIVQYNKSWGMQRTYDIFWDDFQKKGTQTYYAYAFMTDRWSEKNFCPKYDITGTDLSGCFSNTRMQIDLVKHLKKCGIQLNTSSATNLASMFNGCYFTHIGEIDVRNYADLRYTFAAMFYCHTVDKLILREDGTNTFTDAFASSKKLVNLTIEGCLGNNIDLHWAQELSKQSIQSIMEAANKVKLLENKPPEFTITLSVAAVNKAYETASGENNGIDSSEWSQIVANASGYYTIVLC